MSRKMGRTKWLVVVVCALGLSYAGACVGRTIERANAPEGSRVWILVKLDAARLRKSELEEKAHKDPAWTDEAARAKLSIDDLEQRLASGPPPSWTEKHLRILPLELIGALVGMSLAALLAAAMLIPASTSSEAEPDYDDRSDRWKGGYGGFPG